MDKALLKPFPQQQHIIRPCMAMELFNLRLGIKKELGRHMNYSRQDQNGRQSRSWPEFGLTRWNYFKHLLYLYECNIKIHKREGYRRISQAKEQMKLVTQRYKVTIEIIRFQYPSELKLLVSLFGENCLKGNRYRNPLVSDPVKYLKDGDNCNLIVSEFSEAEEAEVYEHHPNHRQWDRHCSKAGIDFIFNGDGQLRTITRYAHVVVNGSGNSGESMTMNELIRYTGDEDVLSGNVVLARDSPRGVTNFIEESVVIHEGMTFQVPVEEEVAPYSSFEIVWTVTNATVNKIQCEIIYPPLAIKHLPKIRDFNNVELVEKCIKASNSLD